MQYFWVKGDASVQLVFHYINSKVSTQETKHNNSSTALLSAPIYPPSFCDSYQDGCQSASVALFAPSQSLPRQLPAHSVPRARPAGDPERLERAKAQRASCLQSIGFT